MKKYMKPAISVIAVETESVIAECNVLGVEGTNDFDTEIIPGPGTGTYYSKKPTSVWDIDEDE